MQPKHPILQKCLHQLESLPNLEVKIGTEPYVHRNLLADGRLFLSANGQDVEYICEIKWGIALETLHLITEYWHNLKQRLDVWQRPLLIAQSLSDRVIDRLIAQNIEFIDTEGNIYLNSPVAYILTRQPQSNHRSSESSEINISALKVIYALLKYPEVLSIASTPENRLTIDSGVPIEKIEKVLDKLYKLDYLDRKHETYQIKDYAKLLARWELGYQETLRPSLLIDTFTPIGDRSFDESTDLIVSKAKELNYSIGGELGAAIVTGYLRPITATLHVPEKNYREIFLNLKLKPSQHGEITFLRQFGISDVLRKWEDPEGVPSRMSSTDPLLIYAELRTIEDERSREVANLLFDKYIQQRVAHAYS